MQLFTLDLGKQTGWAIFKVGANFSTLAVMVVTSKIFTIGLILWSISSPQYTLKM